MALPAQRITRGKEFERFEPTCAPYPTAGLLSLPCPRSRGRQAQGV